MVGILRKFRTEQCGDGKLFCSERQVREMLLRVICYGMVDF